MTWQRSAEEKAARLISFISAAPASTCWLDGFKQKEVHLQEICSKWSTGCCYCLLQYKSQISF